MDCLSERNFVVSTEYASGIWNILCFDLPLSYLIEGISSRRSNSVMSKSSKKLRLLKKCSEVHTHDGTHLKRGDTTP